MTNRETSSKPVYAKVHLLPNFKPGDRLDGRLDPAVLELVVKNGDASYTRPKS